MTRKQKENEIDTIAQNAIDAATAQVAEEKPQEETPQEKSPLDVAREKRDAAHASFKAAQESAKTLPVEEALRIVTQAAQVARDAQSAFNSLFAAVQVESEKRGLLAKLLAAENPTAALAHVTPVKPAKPALPKNPREGTYHAAAIAMIRDAGAMGARSVDIAAALGHKTCDNTFRLMVRGPANPGGTLTEEYRINPTTGRPNKWYIWLGKPAT